MSHLSKPLQLKRGPAISNRFFKSAMSEQLGDDAHNPTPGLAKLYGTWAKGGTGLLVTGNVMIDRKALGEPKNVVLDEKSDLGGFKAWASAAHAGGAQIWMQLNHPGKQSPSFLSKQPVAPSAIPLGKGLDKAFATPRAMTEADIQKTIGDFATSARLAKEAGFDGVQIHGAHGYLVSQFLSPRHNKREDEWGGSAEKRSRFAIEVYKAIRAAVGDEYPVGIKLNSADFQKDGFTEEESMDVINALQELGLDLLEVSGGNYESPSMMGNKQKASTVRREAYFLAFAEKIRAQLEVPLVVTGGFRSTEGMSAALEDDVTDMIGLARPLCIHPDLPKKALADAHYKIELPNPSTGIKALDRMGMVGLTWYESQIARMALGKEPKPSMSAWRALGDTMMHVGRHAFKKRRA